MFKDVCFAVLFLLLGGCSGVLLMFRWWATQMRKPEQLKGFINGLRMSAESNPGTREALDKLFPPRRLCVECGASCASPTNTNAPESTP